MHASRDVVLDSNSDWAIGGYMTTDNKSGDKPRKLSSAAELRKYTQDIWLAGLGAFSRA